MALGVLVLEIRSCSVFEFMLFSASVLDSVGDLLVLPALRSCSVYVCYDLVCV